jgi:hypothetical protein
MTDNNEERITNLESQLADTAVSLERTLIQLENLCRIVERIANHLEWAGVVSRGLTIDRENE